MLARPSQRLSRLSGVNVYAYFSEVARRLGAVNLGQGFPSFAPPAFLREEAAASTSAADVPNHQYTRPAGHPILVEAIAKEYEQGFGRKLDPLTHVATFSGAQEAIAAAIFSYCDEGSNVVICEPFFDATRNSTSMLGVDLKGVPLRCRHGLTWTTIAKSEDLVLHRDDLECCIDSKTRLLVLNTPNNPTGKVSSQEELQMISEVVAKYPDIIVLSDEVYEHMTFDCKHHHFAALPGMFERTISLFSAGKSFSATGWRCGYAIGPHELLSPLTKYRQTTTFCGVVPVEIAVGKALEQARSAGYYDDLQRTLRVKRDRLMDILRKAGLSPVLPEGGYFVMADVGPLMDKASLDSVEEESKDTPDWAVAHWFAKRYGVIGIPMSVFFVNEESRRSVSTVLRFCFVKEDSTLDAAEAALLR